LVSPVAGNPANVSPVLMFHFFPISVAVCNVDEQAFILVHRSLPDLILRSA